MELARRSLKDGMRSASALTSPGAVRDYLRLAIADREHEVFVCLWLDAQHRVMSLRGIVPRHADADLGLSARNREGRAAGQCRRGHLCAQPSVRAWPQPSQADELLTRNLKEALALVDVKVLDHFIVAGHQTLSFAERGLL